MKAEIDELGAVTCKGRDCSNWLDQDTSCDNCPVVMLFNRAYVCFIGTNKKN